MSSIDTLLKRAKRLHGVNDDALEAEWNNMLDMEVEGLLADLEAKINAMTPEEREAEEQNSIPLTPELEAELDAALASGGEAEKKYWFEWFQRFRRIPFLSSHGLSVCAGT